MTTDTSRLLASLGTETQYVQPEEWITNMGENYFVVRRYKGSGDWFHISGGDGTAVAILMIPVFLFIEFVRWLSHGRRWEVIRVTETVESPRVSWRLG
jgi:hypothetical protein